VRTAFGSEFRDQTNNTALDASATLDPTDVADAIAYATEQETPVTVTELDVNRRDIFERF
jgi:NADP-dependent 3-hydroxy acid dehydrogenase YdfG